MKNKNSQVSRKSDGDGGDFAVLPKYWLDCDPSCISESEFTRLEGLYAVYESEQKLRGKTPRQPAEMFDSQMLLNMHCLKKFSSVKEGPRAQRGSEDPAGGAAGKAGRDLETGRDQC
jgi:hypothetical protein